MKYIETVYGSRVKSTYPLEFCKHIIERYNIKKGSKILDVGCGDTMFLQSFVSLGMYTEGIDRDDYHPDVKHISDLEKDKFPCYDSDYDIVFSKSVIEHIYNPDHFIKECKRVLKPNGKLILLSPDWITQQNVFYEDHTHVHPYTTTSMRDMLTMYGFGSVESELFYQLPVVWKYKYMKIVCRFLQLFLKPKLKRYDNKFLRWSIELMVLATGVKNV